MATRTDAATEAWALFWKVFQEDKRRRWGLLSDLGLTPMQGMALSHLDAEDPPTMSQLAGAVQCDNSSVTGIVDRLEKAGFVERQPAAHDRRVKCIALTDEGRELQQRLRATMASPPPAFATLSADEAAQLRDLLAAAVERAEL